MVGALPVAGMTISKGLDNSQKGDSMSIFDFDKLKELRPTILSVGGSTILTPTLPPITSPPELTTNQDTNPRSGITIAVTGWDDTFRQEADRLLAVRLLAKLLRTSPPGRSS